jgi:hypothetical protein
MRQKLISICLALLALIAPAIAAIDPMTGPMYFGRASEGVDQWQRIDFRSARLPLRRAAQIKVAIQTKGPSMQGLIRIPGAPASNFDTGNGMTVVDLINVGDEAKGYAEIVALEVLFTQTTPSQSFLAVDYADGKREQSIPKPL